MSELNSFIVRYNGKFIRVYEEAELEESHKKEVGQLLMEIVEMKKACNDKDYWCLHTLKENRHHKYKRCLAMAKWCKTSARCDEGLGAFKYRDWYWKWFKRWMKLAEQFKEAK